VKFAVEIEGNNEATVTNRTWSLEAGMFVTERCSVSDENGEGIHWQ
jgi:hypothetical protein